MTLLARLRSWLHASLRRSRFEREMQEEMRAHVALYEADLRRRGVSPAEAHRLARAEFGSVEARKEECRQARGLRFLDEARGDVTYACRLLRRSPAFTVVALLSLGLGMGANTAVFSLIDTVLVKSLPVEDPDTLFFVDNTGGRSRGSSGPPYPCFERLRGHNRFLSGIAAFNENRFKVTIDGVAERWRGQHASGTYFELLGVRAIHGRLLTSADDSIFGHGGPDGPVAVISYGLWQRRFGLDPDVLGKSLLVGTQAVTIVGVTPPEFFGLETGSPIDITLPMMLAGDVIRSKETWWMSIVARLKPGASVEQARADLDALFDSYMLEIGQPRERRTHFPSIALVPAARGLDGLRRTYSEPLLILMAIVAVVLLIGCANVANLLLARASARQPEIAVRFAIGATRSRLIRQLITEGVVLVACGAALGLLFANWGVSFLVGILAGPSESIVLDAGLDGRLLAFTAVVGAITVLLFSLAPAVRATSIDAARPATAGTTSVARPGFRLGQSIVIIQVTLSVILLCSAALFLRTLHNLNRQPSGFDREGVWTGLIEATIPPRSAAPKTPAEHRFEHARLGIMWQELATRVADSPGVSWAAVGTLSPLTGRDRGVRIGVRGGAVAEAHRGIHVNQVTPGYFETVGIRLLSGRLFTASDRAGSLRVAILNETGARAYFAGENPLGRKVNFPRQRVEDEYEIVGVVADTRYQNLRTPDERMVYLPIEQSIDPVSNAMLSIRGPGDLTRFTSVVRRAVAETVPGGFLANTGTIDQRVQASLVRERMLSLLATFFAGLALTLACIGLYGVVAYRVVRRTREIGIRIAVGAERRSVTWMLVRETLMMVTIGGALGAAASLAASRYVASQLFGVTPGDPLATAAALIVLAAVTLLAGYVPARRASRIDPVVALRL